MSDILADIDDTLADWNGSIDSMRWRPSEPPSLFTTRQPTSEQLQALAEHWQANVLPQVQRTMAVYIESMKRALEAVAPLARALGYLPATPPRPSKLDARYHQRQKNRRKRRR